ncbi:hypothetical protein EWH91_05405 [Sporolactobacillus sp. THM19-2]|nr:hypothetical protein EWH91_05405 [Sporolactobacillus sp. THM19-2]
MLDWNPSFKKGVPFLEKEVGVQPFVNQVHKEKEMKMFYRAGFRPYGKRVSEQEAIAMLKSHLSICMIKNIDN